MIIRVVLMHAVFPTIIYSYYYTAFFQLLVQCVYCFIYTPFSKSGGLNIKKILSIVHI